MFLFEQWQDGFVITVEGRRILHHRRRQPALFVLKPRKRQATAENPDTPAVWKALGSFSIVNENTESRLLRFDETLELRFHYINKVLYCQFKALDLSIRGLRLVFNAESEEMLFGLGEYCSEAETSGNLKGLKIATDCSNTLSVLPEPVVFSNRNWWIQTERAACPAFDFQLDKTIITLSAIPDVVQLGFGAKPASALVLLTSQKLAARGESPNQLKKRYPLPGWVFEGALIGHPERVNSDVLKPIRTAALISGHSDETDTIRVVQTTAWNHLLSVSAVQSLEARSFLGKKAYRLVRQVLANSFSGVGYQALVSAFSPVSAAFSENSTHKQQACAAPEYVFLLLSRILDIAIFSPLLIVDFDGLNDDKENEGAFHHFLKNLARASELHAKLAEYHEYCSYLWQSRGLPVFCHPSVFYPNEKVLWNFDDTYLYGSDVLIAPSLPDDSRTRQLYLPDDEWVHFWTSRNFSGGVAVVDAPSGRPAVFFRKNSAFAALFDDVRKAAVKLFTAI